jgi:hypothetical protein
MVNFKLRDRVRRIVEGDLGTVEQISEDRERETLYRTQFDADFSSRK